MSIITEKETLRDAALSYASRGWAVLPLRGKVPAIPKKAGGHGYLDATIEAAQVRAWWQSYPQANIGIASRASSLVIMDVDPRKGGEERLFELESQYDALSDTVEVITGSGGRHFYFQAPTPDTIKRKTDALGKGVDLPNYVVAPPSIHPDTEQPYLWEASSHPDDVPLAACPAWIIRLSEKRPTSQRIYSPLDDGSISWESILYPHGWEPVLQDGPVTRWRRPGKDSGWSATTEFIPGRLFLFTTDGGPLEADRPYSKLAAFAVLNGVSFQKAARRLGVTLPYRMTFLGLKSLSTAWTPAPPVLRRQV